MDNNKKQLEFTTSDMVNVLQHGATREDISEIRKDLKISLLEYKKESKESINGLYIDINSIKSEVSRKIDKLENAIKTGFGLAVVLLITLHFFH